jgi:hypothetical protein
MKKRGKERAGKKAVSKSRSVSKSKGTHFDNNVFLIISAILLSVLLFSLGFIKVSNTITGHQVSTRSGGVTATTICIDRPFICFVTGDPFSNPEKIDPFLKNVVLGNIGVWIIHIMVWMILFFSFYYVFKNFLFIVGKSTLISLFVAFGLAVIAANLGVITSIVGGLAALLAIFGAASVFVAMGVAFVFFVWMTLVGNKIRLLRAKQIRTAIESGGEKAAGTVSSLLKMGKELQKGGI